MIPNYHKELGFNEWRSDKWCVAALQLCEWFERHGQDTLVQYPEQWIYFLWRPCEQAIPYREPDCIAFTIGNPFDEIGESIEGDPFYLLRDEECDWVSLLEISRVCEDLEEWIDDLILRLIQEKRLKARERWLRNYGLNGFQEPSTTPNK